MRAQPLGEGTGGRLHLAEVESAVGAAGVGAQITAVRTRPSWAGSVPGRNPPECIRRSSAGLSEPASGPVA